MTNVFPEFYQISMITNIIYFYSSDYFEMNFIFSRRFLTVLETIRGRAAAAAGTCSGSGQRGRGMGSAGQDLSLSLSV